MSDISNTTAKRAEMAEGNPVPVDHNGQQYPVHSPLNGGQPLFARLGYDDLRTLEGRLLTLADASFPDPQQRKAFKDILRRTIWFDWANYLDLAGGSFPGSVGMPVNTHGD